MIRHRRLQQTRFVLAIALVAQGCDKPRDDDSTPTSTADEQVDLDSMLSVVGKADITHGTGPYQAPAGAPSDQRAERVFLAFLSGGQEVPAVGTRAEGAMALFLDRQETSLRFVLQHRVSEPTVAHIHIGSAGENGPVAIALPKADPVSTGVLPVTADQVKELRAGRLYANVHSRTNAGGEIRGQILRPGETVFVASLRGVEEVPAVGTTASAQASLILNGARDQIRYRVAFTGISPTAAHVHRGIAGVNGPVVFPLAAVGSTGSTIEGAFSVGEADIQDLALRQFYVNLHSAARPLGEVRGQVVRPGEAVFVANLTGAQEVPPASGSNTGNAMVVLGSAGGKFLYVVKTDATPTVAHIHRAPGGVNGPVEVPLDPAGQTMSGFEELGPARLADVGRGLWYVNIHTASHPMGALRGQVLRPGEELFTAALAGANEVPPTSSTASGGIGVILDAARTEIRYDGAATGVMPTLAHVHDAPVGSNGPVAFPLAFTDTTLSGTQAVTPEDVARLEGNGFYVNIHSAANPMGDIRGQLGLVSGSAPAGGVGPRSASAAAAPPSHTH